jgi:hypothetical protein
MDRTRVFEMLAVYEKRKSTEEILKRADRCLGFLPESMEELVDRFPELRPMMKLSDRCEIKIW